MRTHRLRVKLAQTGNSVSRKLVVTAGLVSVLVKRVNNPHKKKLPREGAGSLKTKRHSTFYVTSWHSSV